MKKLITTVKIFFSNYFLLLSQLCEKVEDDLDNEQLANYVNHIHEIQETCNSLEIDEEEVQNALDNSIDCTEMSFSRGCTNLSSWSMPTEKKGEPLKSLDNMCKIRDISFFS